MRFMVLVKSVPGEPEEPDEAMFEAMARYNEELAKAGVLLTGEGLLPADRGALVRFRNGVPTVLDGPFAESKEVVSGFWMLEVRSREEVVEWVKRIPVPENVPFRVEIRPVYAPGELGEPVR